MQVKIASPLSIAEDGQRESLQAFEEAADEVLKLGRG